MRKVTKIWLIIASILLQFKILQMILKDYVEKEKQC